MDRRDFLKSLGMYAVTLSVPQTLWGCSDETLDPDDDIVIDPEWEGRVTLLEEEGILTKSEPGPFADKIVTHLPIVSFLEGDGTIDVLTNHEMTPEHWIQAHYVRDQNGKVIAFREYDNSELYARTSFQLPTGTTQITAYSFCNLHWSWFTSTLDLT